MKWILTTVCWTLQKDINFNKIYLNIHHVILAFFFQIIGKRCSKNLTIHWDWQVPRPFVSLSASHEWKPPQGLPDSKLLPEIPYWMLCMFRPLGKSHTAPAVDSRLVWRGHQWLRTARTGTNPARAYLTVLSARDLLRMLHH